MEKLDHSSQGEALSLLGEVLADMEERLLHLVVSGGAALLATGIVLRVTKDVDVLGVIGEIDREISSGYPLPGFLKEAVKRVAVELELRPDWLNASTALVMIDFERFPEGVLLSDHVEREYGSDLRITFIGRKGQIYLKMYAASERKEDRDLQDLRALNLTVEEAEEVVGWIFDEEVIDKDREEEVFRVLRAIDHEGVIHRIKRTLS
jgi:hypothetical protein